MPGEALEATGPQDHALGQRIQAEKERGEFGAAFNSLQAARQTPGNAERVDMSAEVYHMVWSFQRDCRGVSTKVQEMYLLL